MMEKGMLIDCGKGNITEEAINLGYELGIDIFRSDVTSGIMSFVDQATVVKKLINNKTGRKMLREDIFLVSGGVYGRLGDIVVDNYSAPEIIYGMADGRGQILENLTKIDLKKIKFVLDFYKINLPVSKKNNEY